MMDDDESGESMARSVCENLTVRCWRVSLPAKRASAVAVAVLPAAAAAAAAQ